MRGGPVVEGASGRSGQVGDRGGHIGGMPDRRAPRGEQHVDDERWPAVGRLGSVRLVLGQQVFPVPTGVVENTLRDLEMRGVLETRRCEGVPVERK